MTPIAKISLLLCATIGQAIEFPGNCADVPPTHSPHLLTNAHYREIVHGVPFTTKHPSHLFKAFDFINMVGYLKFKALENNHYSLIISYKNSMYGFRGNLSTPETKENQSMRVTSEMTLGYTACHGLVTEEIRMWSDEELLIIWSCIANDSVNTHDEAVLFLSKDISYVEAYSSPENYRKIMHIINSTARKYLGDSLLLDIIDWEKDIANKTANLTYVKFGCPLKPLEVWHIKEEFAIFFISVFLFSFSLLIVFGILCDDDE